MPVYNDISLLHDVISHKYPVKPHIEKEVVATLVNVMSQVEEQTALDIIALVINSESATIASLYTKEASVHQRALLFRHHQEIFNAFSDIRHQIHKNTAPTRKVEWPPPGPMLEVVPLPEVLKPEEHKA